MKARRGVRAEVSKLVEERLKKEKLSVGRVPAVIYASPPLSPTQDEDNYDPTGVTGLRTGENSYLTGNVSINGKLGLTTEQIGQEIQIVSTKVKFHLTQEPLCYFQNLERSCKTQFTCIH